MTSDAERKHAKLSASGSSRWLACPGSVLLEEGLPDTTSEFAEYGTAGHELAETCLREDVPAHNFAGIDFNKSDSYPDGFEADEEMCEAVQMYLDYCNNVPGGEPFIEERVNFSQWVPEGFGTADFIRVEEPTGVIDPKTIHVVDLKMGKGVRVFAEDNPQAMLYALGVTTMGEKGYYSSYDEVNVVIVQPRLDHISEWRTTVGHLRDWGRDTVVPSATKAWNKEPVFKPGEKQCRFCKASPTCKALLEHSLQTVMHDFDEIPEGDMNTKDVHTLSNEELGKIMKHVNTITSWAKGLEATALEKLEAGEKIPGYKMVQGRAGNRKWVDEDVLMDKMMDLGFDEEQIVQPRKLLTPPKMCKILGAKNISMTQIQDLWIQPEGKPTIAVESDKREEIVPSGTDGFDVIN